MRSSNPPNQKELMQQLMNNQRNPDPSPKPTQSLPRRVERSWDHYHMQARQSSVRKLLEGTAPDDPNHETIAALQAQVEWTQEQLKDHSQDEELRSQFFSLLVLLNEVKNTKDPDQDLLTKIQTANKKADDEKRQALQQIAQQFLINKATITIKANGQSLQEFLEVPTKAKSIGVQYSNRKIHQFSHKGENQLQTDNIPPSMSDRRRGIQQPKKMAESLLCVGNKLILSGISVKGSRGDEERLETLCLLLYKKKLAELQNSTDDTRYIAEGTPLPIIKLKNVSPTSYKEYVTEHLLTCYFKKVSIDGVTYGLDAEGEVTDIEKLKDVSGSAFRTPSM